MMNDLVENRTQKQDENILISKRFHPCTSKGEGTKSNGSHIPAVPVGAERPQAFFFLFSRIYLCFKSFFKE